MYRNTPASMQFVEQNSPIKSIVYFKSSFLRSKGSSSCSIRFGSLFLFLNTKRCNAKPNTSLLNLPYPEWSVAECCTSLSERTTAAQSLSLLSPPSLLPNCLQTSSFVCLICRVQLPVCFCSLDAYRKDTFEWSFSDVGSCCCCCCFVAWFTPLPHLSDWHRNGNREEEINTTQPSESD